jgi:putative transposase
MYRLLDEHGEVRERRDKLTRPPCQKPELMATASNQLWSWDITKLLGPVRWTYLYLYVVLDVFSRYVTGWMVAYRESAELAKRPIAESCNAVEPCNLPFTSQTHSRLPDKVFVLLLCSFTNSIKALRRRR